MIAICLSALVRLAQAVVRANGSQHGHKASVLGRGTPEPLADRILEYTATFGFQATTFAEYRRSLLGYRPNLDGGFFEWLVEACPERRGDMLHWAGLETSLISELARRTCGRSLAELARLPERIVNARNQPVLLPMGGAFQPSARAEGIWLWAGPGA